MGRQDGTGAEGRWRKVQSRQIPIRGQLSRENNLDTEGQVKFLAEAETDRVLGVHIIGAESLCFRVSRCG